jgi:hypothetical protein
MRRHPLDALWDQLVKEYMATEPKPNPQRDVRSNGEQRRVRA